MFKYRIHTEPLQLCPVNHLPVQMHIGERLGVVNGEHAEEALASPHVLISHGAVLLLSRRVQDVQQTRLPINYHLLPVRVLHKDPTKD